MVSNTCHSVHFPDPCTVTAHTSLTEISNIVHCSPTTASVNGTSVDDLFSLLSPSHPTVYVGRVATVDRHDTDAWTQEWNAHDTKFHAVATSPSFDSNGAVPSDCSPVEMARDSSTLMELRTQGLRNVKQFSNATRRQDTLFRPRHWIFLDTPGSGVSAVQPNVTINPWPHEDLSEGRRRVGEILTRCGVINVSGMSPIESTAIGCCDTSHSRPVDAPVTSNVTAEMLFGDNNRVLITALADWTSGWVYTLVIQPYLRGGFRFQCVIQVLTPSDLIFVCDIGIRGSQVVLPLQLHHGSAECSVMCATRCKSLYMPYGSSVLSREMVRMTMRLSCPFPSFDTSTTMVPLLQKISCFALLSLVL